MNLLEKGAIEIVPPAQSESGFYSRYFLVPKKEGGMRPILDLRLLNYALMKKSFRVITLKQILPQICPGNGLCSWRWKTHTFTSRQPPHYRQFLRFAFEGVAYQYKVLPFGLYLAPCTFTRCMDTALSPLRQMGIRILNYLDSMADPLEMGPPLSSEWHDMESTAWVMGPACVTARREPFVLPECVLNTMTEARAPSTRCLCALKWAIFSTWYQERHLDPVTSDVSVVLSFLQEMLDKQRSSSTIKVYAAAIAAFHAPNAGRSVGRVR